MNVNELSTRLLQPIKFKGNDNEWALWSKKFLAGARIKKYLPLLEGKIPIPEIDEEKEEDSHKKNIRDLNDKEMYDIIYASDNEMFFDCIDSAEGNSFRAWENLKDMYEPRNVRAKIDLLNEFRGRNLNIGEDPDEWISELTRIKLKLKNLFNEIITDKDFIVNIINGLNRQYSQVQGSLEYQLESKSDPLTVEVIKVHLRARFNRIKKSSGETALNTRRSNTV